MAVEHDHLTVEVLERAETEVAVLEKLRDMEVPEDPDAATMAFHGKAYEEVEKDIRARGADMFDIPKVTAEVEMNAVEFMFPHYFVLPSMGAMASYRCRPLTPETCYFEIWSLVIRPDGEEYDTPTRATSRPPPRPRMSRARPPASGSSTP